MAYCHRECPTVIGETLKLWKLSPFPCRNLTVGSYRSAWCSSLAKSVNGQKWGRKKRQQIWKQYKQKMKSEGIDFLVICIKQYRRHLYRRHFTLQRRQIWREVYRVFFFRPLATVVLTFSGDILSQVLSLCEKKPQPLDYIIAQTIGIYQNVLVWIRS